MTVHPSWGDDLGFSGEEESSDVEPVSSGTITTYRDVWDRTKADPSTVEDSGSSDSGGTSNQGAWWDEPFQPIEETGSSDPPTETEQSDDPGGSSGTPTIVRLGGSGGIDGKTVVAALLVALLLRRAA